MLRCASLLLLFAHNCISQGHGTWKLRPVEPEDEQPAPPSPRSPGTPRTAVLNIVVPDQKQAEHKIAINERSPATDVKLSTPNGYPPNLSQQQPQPAPSSSPPSIAQPALSVSPVAAPSLQLPVATRSATAPAVIWHEADGASTPLGLSLEKPPLLPPPSLERQDSDTQADLKNAKALGINEEIRFDDDDTDVGPEPIAARFGSMSSNNRDVELFWTSHVVSVSSGCPSVNIFGVKVTYALVARYLTLLFSVGGLMLRFISILK